MTNLPKKAFQDEIDEAVKRGADEQTLRTICEKHGVPFIDEGDGSDATLDIFQRIDRALDKYHRTLPNYGKEERVLSLLHRLEAEGLTVVAIDTDQSPTSVPSMPPP